MGRLKPLNLFRPSGLPNTESKYRYDIEQSQKPVQEFFKNIQHIEPSYFKTDCSRLLSGTLTLSGSIQMSGNIDVQSHDLLNVNSINIVDHAGRTAKIGYWNSNTAGGIATLIGGSSVGTLIEGAETGHLTLAIRENGDTDKFSVISGGGNYSPSTHTYDKVCLESLAQGYLGIGRSAVTTRTINAFGQHNFYFYRANNNANNTLLGCQSDVGGTEVQHFIVQNDGDVLNTNNSYGAISDERLKENIVADVYGLEAIEQIQPKRFSFKRDNKAKPTHRGFLAQEVQQVLPDLVKEQINEETGETNLCVNYMGFVPILVQSVKQLSNELITVKQENQTLRDRIDAMEGRLVSLERNASKTNN